MHPEIKSKRNLLDMAKEEFLQRCDIDPSADLEASLKLSGFRLKSLFANIPFPKGYEDKTLEYEQQINDKKIMDYAFIPAWWVPSAMEQIIEKELLPFAIYTK